MCGYVYTPLTMERYNFWLFYGVCANDETMVNRAGSKPIPASSGCTWKRHAPCS
ncbi:hypothetical protein HanRHA438_Chr13g0602971 [Helianthus annuus]|nr:hypothetical protein HanRHA438_Chr13g0602971 [Helianthus annuus]